MLPGAMPQAVEFCTVGAERWSDTKPPHQILLLHALNVGVELEKFFINMLVAAINVIEAGNGGGAFGGETCKHQSRRGAQIARHHRRGRELLHTFDDRGAIVDVDVGAHALHFGTVHEALRATASLARSRAGLQQPPSVEGYATGGERMRGMGSWIDPPADDCRLQLRVTVRHAAEALRCLR